MRMLQRVAVRFLVFGGALWAAGKLVEQLSPRLDDPSGDEFDLTTITGGTEFVSEAESLRTGVVFTLCGGIDIDLRGATLDMAGAAVRVVTVCGGTRMVVPEEWKVIVSEQAVAGGNEVATRPPEDAPADAPTLRLTLVTYAGGVLVTTHEDDDLVVAARV